ncbi:MAG: glycosyltransferase family 4 protein [Pirellulales bacterium]|nr:glycosyltransferase family 4 protein [Pirellulales bacterium]
MICAANNMKVLLISDVFPPGICGIGDYSAKLASALAARGVEVNVLTKFIPGAPPEEEIDGIAVHRLARHWTLADARPVLQIADQLGPGTIVHLQYPSLTGYERRPMINLLPAIFRTLKRQFPLVVTMHGFHEHRMRWKLRALPMLWTNTALVFVHRRDRELASRWAPFSARRSVMIPIASNVEAVNLDRSTREQLRWEYGFAGNDIVAAYFGEVRPDKGLHSLLSAIESCRRRKLNAKVLVISTVGTQLHGMSSYEREMLAKLDQAARDGWASLARAETSERVAQLLQVSDLAVFPFTLGAAENRGSVLAAIINGLPVLTTRGISTPIHYEADFGVETVAAGDQCALNSQLVKLIESPVARAALADKSRGAAGRFSWSHIADQTIEVYRKCLTM